MVFFWIYHGSRAAPGRGSRRAVPMLLALLVMACGAGPAGAQTPSTGELARAREIYQGQLGAIDSDVAAKLQRGEASILATLGQMEKEYQAAGDLHGVLAVKSERYQVKPDTNATIMGISVVPQKVKDAHAAYLECRRKIEAEKAAQVQVLSQKYLSHLETLKRDFTRQGKIDAALSADAEMGLVRKAADARKPAGEPAGEQAKAVAAPPEPAAESMENRLKGIPIRQWRFYGNSPVSLLNELIDAVFPKGINLKIETDQIPLMSVYYDSDGKPRYAQRYDGSREVSRQTQAVSTNALEGLQGICDMAGLGYKLEKDLIVVTDPDEAKATWFRKNVQADELAGEFSADSARAAESYKGKPVRITGMLASLSRNMSGNMVVVLQAPRLIRVEMASKADDALMNNLKSDLERTRMTLESMQKNGQLTKGTPRRLGESVSTPAQPVSGTMPAVRVSVVATYSVQSGMTLVFDKGGDLWWNRIDYVP